VCFQQIDVLFKKLHIRSLELVHFAVPFCLSASTSVIGIRIVDLFNLNPLGKTPLSNIDVAVAGETPKSLPALEAETNSLINLEPPKCFDNSNTSILGREKYFVNTKHFERIKYL
jgi:hypothetical protein